MKSVSELITEIVKEEVGVNFIDGNSIRQNWMMRGYDLAIEMLRSEEAKVEQRKGDPNCFGWAEWLEAQK
jgi:hypothetical protein